MQERCLPKEVKDLKYEVKLDKIKRYIQHIKHHTLICNFIGIWPMEIESVQQIQQKWQLKGQNDVKLGEKGFFTIIFENIEDKTRVFENGPYLFNCVGLFMKFWKER